MIIGEWKMNVVAIMKLIYRLKVSTLISSNKIWDSIPAYTKNLLVSWSDNKELSSEANAISRNSLKKFKKKKAIFNLKIAYEILEQTLFWDLASIGLDSQNFYFLPNTTSSILWKKTCTPFKIENFKFKKGKGKSPTQVEA